MGRNKGSPWSRHCRRRENSMSEGYDSLRSERVDFSSQSDPLYVKRAASSGGVSSGSSVNRDGRQHHKHQNEQRQPKENKDYFRAMSKAAEATNTRLKQEQSPIRFCVYMEKGEVFIDLIQMDGVGKIIHETRRNITHEDFSRWIEDITKGEGLLFDSEG